MSKHIRQLEEELGVDLFIRNGKHLTRLTPIGEAVVAKAETILADTANIRVLADEYRDHKRGTLSIATTHTQARYALPSVVKRFRECYPDVALRIHQGSPTQIAELAASGSVDFAIGD